MLDNLRLDLSDSRVFNNVTDLNTNSTETALDYMKNGGASASDLYATLRANYRNWANSYTHNYMSVSMILTAIYVLRAGICQLATTMGSTLHYSAHIIIILTPLILLVSSMHFLRHLPGDS